jgi:hypothetical protein
MKVSVINWIVMLVIVVLLILNPACSASSRIKGIVFEDHNQNGIKDEGESGIPEVLVSNGISVAVTGKKGEYALSNDDSFVFITTPSGYEPSTSWYREIQEENRDFGLVYSLPEDFDEFFFIQMTDIHLDTEPEHLAVFRQVVDEINQISPAFVVATGDLILGGDQAEILEAQQWYDAYSNLARDYDMPLYNALGNHDVVGIHCEEAANTDPGYNEEMYQDYFGPTYYSFDYGEYHCLVLDPNDLVDGRQIYRIPETQLEWLRQDLHHRGGSPLLVFFHEPTPSWENRAEVMDLLKQRSEVTMLSGHWHYNVLMDDQYVQEKVTGALSGEWWFGPCPDGEPAGYSIVTVDNTGVSTFYKGIGQERKINITSPDSSVSGETAITAQIYTEHGIVQDAFYKIDDGDFKPMAIEKGVLWDLATAVWNTTQVEQGYHTISIEARDEAGIFSNDRMFKITEEDTVPICDLISQFDVFQGQLTTIRGQIDLVAMGEPYIGEGSGAIVLSDETGGMAVIVGECITPPVPELTSGDTITVQAIPIKYSWDFLSVAQELGLIQQYAHLLPEGLLVSDESGPTELMLMRLPSGDCIQKME